jgi:hypothetical protein
VAKGKRKKLALIVVYNKLLKQAFAIAKNRIPTVQGYRSPLSVNYWDFACFYYRFFAVNSFRT